jgi:hypothetical protein
MLSDQFCTTGQFTLIETLGIHTIFSVCLPYVTNLGRVYCTQQEVTWSIQLQPLNMHLTIMIMTFIGTSSITCLGNLLAAKYL